MIISPREKKMQSYNGPNIMKVRFRFGSILCCAYSLLTKLEVMITWLGRFFLRNLKFIWPKNLFFAKKGGLGEGKWRRGGGALFSLAFTG